MISRGLYLFGYLGSSRTSDNDKKKVPRLFYALKSEMQKIYRLWNLGKVKETNYLTRIKIIKEMKNNNYNASQERNEKTTVIVNQMEKKSNGVGTAGFVLALCGIFFSWIPVFNWILWALGFIFSFVGIFRKPRGLAIAGLVISCLDLIILIAVIGLLATIFSM